MQNVLISGWRAREEGTLSSEKGLVREKREQGCERGRGWVRGGVWRFGCVLGVRNVQMRYGEELVGETKGSL